MRITRKTLITLFILFLFGGTIIIQAVNVLLRQEAPLPLTETVIMETSKGVILIELDFVNAPITASNFKQYVEDGFFDGTVFHRVIKGFMIQGGGFTSDAVQKVTRNPIKLESDNGLKNNRGAIAMARTNVPDSATSQFFINTEKNSFLDYTSNNPGYAVFGKVIEGMDVVEIIEAAETDTNDWPLENIIIKRVYMKER